ncbi:MAG: copper resistance protein CopC [Actinomycetota bacterium]|nr:copper resistance protein CopC [Actinomycetota bacterium]
MIWTRLVLVASSLVFAVLAGPAGAHGDIQATDPEELATVRRPPRSVAITFSEAPTAQAALNVRDGCRREVTQGVDITGATATARVAIGQPGRWRVSYRVISALDGHETKGIYTFTVAGRKDCTPGEPTATATPDGPGAAPTPQGDDAAGSSAPVVPIAFGALAVVVLAFIVRRSGTE